MNKPENRGKSEFWHLCYGLVTFSLSYFILNWKYETTGWLISLQNRGCCWSKNRIFWLSIAINLKRPQVSMRPFLGRGKFLNGGVNRQKIWHKSNIYPCWIIGNKRVRWIETNGLVLKFECWQKLPEDVLLQKILTPFLNVGKQHCTDREVNEIKVKINGYIFDMSKVFMFQYHSVIFILIILWRHMHHRYIKKTLNPELKIIVLPVNFFYSINRVTAELVWVYEQH